MKFVLGTSSLWRRDIFKRQLGELYTSDEESFAVADIDEKAIRHENPNQMVRLIAMAKAEEIRNSVADDVILLTLDQVVVYQGKVREKPESEEEAKTFLSSYRASDFIECVNGIALIRLDNGKKLVDVETSSITFHQHFNDERIDEAVRSGIPMTTAGGFSISDPIIGKWVSAINGHVTSIEGFPVPKIVAMIRELCPELPRLQYPEKLGQIRCILFDMDGLLLDTETMYSVAQQQILDRFDLTFTWEVKSKMTGRKALDAANIMIDHYGIRDVLDAADFLREREEILDKLFPSSELLPGVERLLLHLHEHNIPIAVATSSHKRHYDRYYRSVKPMASASHVDGHGFNPGCRTNSSPTFYPSN
jgi:MAF protein